MRCCYEYHFITSASALDFQQYGMCDQQSLRSACAYDCEATDWTPFGVSKLLRRLHRLVWVYTCQNDTMLEITCHGSRYNYNCHNIYWDPLIWFAKNGHLIALTCILFFNEPSPYSWGGGPFTKELLLWYCAIYLDRLQLLTLNTLHLHLHIYFQVEKQRWTYIRRLN